MPECLPKPNKRGAGRKPKPPGEKLVALVVQVTPEQARIIRAEALDRDITISGVMREAVALWIAERQSIEEILCA